MLPASNFHDQFFENINNKVGDSLKCNSEIKGS